MDAFRLVIDHPVLGMPHAPHHHMLYFGSSGLNQEFELGKGLGGLHAIVAHPLEAFRHDVLDHAANKGLGIHRPVEIASNAMKDLF